MLHFDAPVGWKDVVRLAFAPDGSALVGACDSRGPVSWDIGTGAVRNYRNIGARPVCGLLIPPDASFVCVPCGYGSLAHFSYPDFEVAPRAYDGGYVLFAALSPDGTRVLRSRFSSGGGVAPYGVALASGPPKWNTLAWERYESGTIPRTGTFLPDGKQVVTAEQTYNSGRGSRLVVRDTATGDMVRSVACSMKELNGLFTSSDGHLLVLMAGRSLYMWDTTNWDAAPKKVPNDTRFNFTSVAFHPSNRYLAVTSNDETVKLYDTTTWELSRAFTWKVGKLRSVCFSPDGALAAAGSDSGKVVVWDVDL